MGEDDGAAAKIWSYPFSEADAASEQKEDVGRQDHTVSDRIGMYLSRSYARYLGGSLERSLLPGVGMNTFLKVNRLDFGAVEI